MRSSRGASKRLIGFLESKDAWVRRSAAHTLGVGKFVEGVGPLTRALGDRDELVVELAIDALGEIGPPAAVAVPALEKLRETTTIPYQRSDITDALEKIRG